MSLARLPEQEVLDVCVGDETEPLHQIGGKRTADFILAIAIGRDAKSDSHLLGGPTHFHTPFFRASDKRLVELTFFVALGHRQIVSKGPMHVLGRIVLDVLDNLSYRICIMKKPLEKWSEIETVAKELGVSEWALRKWAERGGVPGKWQIPLIVRSKGRLSVNDFLTASEKAA